MITIVRVGQSGSEIIIEITVSENDAPPLRQLRMLLNNKMKKGVFAPRCSPRYQVGP